MHVYARIAGHGVALVPRAPFLIRRTEQGVFVRHDDLSADIITPEGGGMRYRLGAGTQDLRAVVQPVDINHQGAFRIETQTFVCAWPEGFALASPDREGPFLFDLVGEESLEGALMFVAGPYASDLCPSIDALCGETQQEVKRGTTRTLDGEVEYIEVAYEHRGETWRQQHHRFPAKGDHVFVLTAQGPEASFDAVREAGSAAASAWRFA